MEIVSLVENTSIDKFKAKHGLSLFIKTKKHNILFDVGPDKTLFRNAKKANIDLERIDIVVISHGHVDHGGALKEFLKINKKAKIYIQESAFKKHYTRFLGIKWNVGLNKDLLNNKQIVLINGDYVIDDELTLFVCYKNHNLCSHINNSLYEENKIDTFKHEQNLLIKENKNVVIMGCGHCGVTNILDSLEKNINIDVCIGGFHLYDPVSKKTVNNEYLNKLCDYLNKNYGNSTFYTCHCTGIKCFDYICKKVDKMNYLHCGEKLIIG